MLLAVVIEVNSVEYATTIAPSVFTFCCLSVKLLSRTTPNY